jgi:small subunit ribosomal protein S14
MSKTSSVYRNLKRVKMAEKYANRRQKQKAIAMDKNAAPEERMQAQFALQKFPRNSAKCRIRNRCRITGRSRSYYRKFGLSRVELRDLASFGEIPGLVKSSW